MAKKDILDRLSQPSSPTVVRKRREEDVATSTEAGKTQTTRVGTKVIRRRRKRGGDTDAAASPPAGLPTMASPSTEEAPAETVEAAPPPVESEAEAPVEAPAAEETVESAPESTEEAPVAETVAVEPAEPAEASAPVESEPKAEAAADAPETVSVEQAAPVEAETAPSEAVVSEGADKRRKMPDLPALGSAVISLPPGYDPANPRKAAEKPAEETSTSPWRSGKPGTRGAGEAGAEKDEGRGGKPRRPKRRGRRQALMDDFRLPTHTRRKRNKRSGPKAPSPQPKAQKRKVQVDGTISVGELAHQLGLKAPHVIKTLMGMGQEATINEQLEFDTVQLVAQEFEYEAVQVGFQEEEHFIEHEDVDDAQVSRAPVVTVMGHVDHGKTTLLDTIRKASVASGEAGGITQHIGAYQVDHNGQSISFIDTPGHEAFTAMRARGAGVTDIVILVVAADDGVMPQTVESINHARAAGVPIIVAVNKCDKPGVTPDTIRQRLMEHELVAEEYGGDTIMCNVSALQGDGIDSLLESVLLVAELQEYKANPDRHAEGVVLEARLEKGRGAVATLLVQKGTLSAGDSLVLGAVAGRVRAMSNHLGEPVKAAGPSMPVEIIGLEGVPVAGDDFTVVKNAAAARSLAEHRHGIDRQQGMSHRQKVTLEDLFSMSEEGETVDLNLVIKADVQGSVEALKASLEGVDVEGVNVKVLHSGVGGITESDVTLATAYNAIILGFNVRPDSKARLAGDSAGVDIRTYKVIYEALDEVKAAALGMLEPTFKEQHESSIEVRKTFTIPKIGTIAGCMVIEGKVVRGHTARLVRDGIVIWEGKLSSLRRFKDDVRDVEKGYECGIGLENYADIKEGDTVETFTLQEVSATA
ncbi:MAG: translation initiation factor IF-2 [Myxococcota bacterium]|nr:translation initiation factor IF-2 [Myxococcota bacterium]